MMVLITCDFRVFSSSAVITIVILSYWGMYVGNISKHMVRVPILSYSSIAQWHPIDLSRSTYQFQPPSASTHHWATSSNTQQPPDPAPVPPPTSRMPRSTDSPEPISRPRSSTEASTITRSNTFQRLMKNSWLSAMIFMMHSSVNTTVNTCRAVGFSVNRSGHFQQHSCFHRVYESVFTRTTIDRNLIVNNNLSG